MAKSSPDSKSKFIRQALQENPGKGPSEVAQILKAQGIEVSNAYVSVVKSSMKKQGRKARRSRKSAEPVVAAARSSSTSGGGGEATGTVEAAVDFVSSVGSFEKARAALAKLEKLSELLGKK